MIKITRPGLRNNISPVILALGNFDGLHRGHMKIIEKTVSDAQKYHSKSAVFSFSNHPVELLKNISVPRLCLDTDKFTTLEKSGVDIWYSIPFTKEFSQLSAEGFIDFLTAHIPVKKVLAGFNYTFGSKKSGNTDSLSSLCITNDIECEIIRPVKYHNNIISSTLIRELILSGNIEDANEMLGRQYKIGGTVIHGEKIGRLMGFPTANISPHKKCLPAPGVYLVHTEQNNIRNTGLLNIGYRPTVSQSNSLSFEVHIMDFCKDIYNTEINLFFIKRLRDEMKFDSIEELKKQISDDIKSVYGGE